MGRFDPAYTHDQRVAISAAVLDRGFTARHAVELAADGRLEDGLAPFEMPVATAQSIVQRARRDSPEAFAVRIDEILDRGLTIAEREIEPLSRCDRKLTTQELTRMHKLLRSMVELQKLIHLTQTPPEDIDPPDPAKVSKLVDRMERDHEANLAGPHLNGART